MPARASQSEDTSQAMILGEMRGQLREVVHSVNNLSSKVDGLSREVFALGPLAADIVDLKARVKQLEGIDARQAGAVGVAQVILKSPLVGWIVGAVISAWAVLSGKVHP